MIQNDWSTNTACCRTDGQRKDREVMNEFEKEVKYLSSISGSKQRGQSTSSITKVWSKVTMTFFTFCIL